MSIFISYSRANWDFVSRLEADLRVRMFKPWVDRYEIRGGQDWMNEIQRAIDACSIMMVVLSPAAAVSRFVNMEIGYAFTLGKKIIPLKYEQCDRVQMALNGLQWVDFTATFEDGLKDLLIALSHVETVFSSLLPVPSIPTSSIDTLENTNLALVPPDPAPTQPPPDLAVLYRMALQALDRNKEQALNLLQQIFDLDPDFQGGIYIPQLKALKRELYPIFDQRLRRLAEQARTAGDWRQEMGAWEALSGMEPPKMSIWQRQFNMLVPRVAYIDERIKTAKKNQDYVAVYKMAQDYVKENDSQLACNQLKILWQEAPYYGDPAQLAESLGLRVPPSYDMAMNRKRRILLTGAALPLLGTVVGGVASLFVGPGAVLTGFVLCSIAGTLLIVVMLL